MHVISEEAINFQPAAAPKTLANEMTALFQETIDFRNKITDSDSHRVKAVTDYFIKNIAPKLIKVIYTYTGIKLSISVPKYLMCNYAVSMEFENDPCTIDTLMRRYSGLLCDKTYPLFFKHQCPIFKTQAELEDFANSLAKDTGIIKAGMMEKHHFKAKLYFDVYSAFLIKETGARACEPFTAHDITAVILHEIGHVITLIEHAADLIFKKDVLDHTIKLFFENASADEKIKYISKMASRIYPEASEAFDKIKTYVATKQQSKGNITYTGFILLFKTLKMLFYLLGVGSTGLLIKLLKNMSNATLGGVLSSLHSTNKIKTGDFAKTSENGSYVEVLSDEYVARFGYAGHLATAMSKLYQWSRISGLGDMQMKQSPTVSWLGRLLPWMLITTFYGDKFSKDYPTEKHRYELMLVNTLKAFKSDNLDENMLEDYYRAYNTIKHVLENPTAEQKYTELCNSLHDVINYLVKTPAELIFSGRFDREYERLYNQVTSLSNNEMYAMAYKLKTLNKGN